MVVSVSTCQVRLVGAVFNIYLPITQSVARVLMVRAGQKRGALPVAMIKQTQKIKRQDLMNAYDVGKDVMKDVGSHLARR